jgi:hypothetical protein
MQSDRTVGSDRMDRRPSRSRMDGWQKRGSDSTPALRHVKKSLARAKCRCRDGGVIAARPPLLFTLAPEPPPPLGPKGVPFQTRFCFFLLPPLPLDGNGDAKAALMGDRNLSADLGVCCWCSDERPASVWGNPVGVNNSFLPSAQRML